MSIIRQRDYSKTMRESGLLIEVNTADLEPFFASLSPKKIELATRRAAVRTRDWLMTNLRRELAAGANIPQRALKTRFRKGKNEPGSSRATMWIGLNPVAARRIGKGISTPRGVQVGRHAFDRAFITTMRKSGYSGIFVRHGRKRLPIVEVTLDIDDDMAALIAKYEVAATRMFSQRLEHEVNYLLGLS